MKNVNTKPVSGTQELLPEQQMIFDNFKQIITNRYAINGYLNVETPILERTDILLAKAGGETEKQIYKVVKTFEADADASEALRFDHTVPLARYVVENESNLVFPFKVAQVGENFRGERAQKGRFREFYQCDIDVIGRETLPLEYDADVISTLLDAFSSFGLREQVVARISNRKILEGLLEVLDLQGKAADIYSIIDHSEKVPAEKTEAALSEIGLSDDEKAKILTFMGISGRADEVENSLRKLGIENNSTFCEGVFELTKVMNLLSQIDMKIVADMRIVRGLDYYTGTVFEFCLSDFKEVGSVCGGGRYENLAGNFAGTRKFPGVGGSIGLNRLFYILREKNLLNLELGKPIDIAVLPVTEAEVKKALEVAAEFRAEGSKVSVVYGDKKLGDKMKYAAKIAKCSIVVGEKEAASGKFEVKEFK
ncbi:histidine--tRNA ligase [Candidatus Saccharibacteria bacterium]|nr:histidine--tRNA ligase [Candidatus Saccharibacteria bacterium]